MTQLPADEHRSSVDPDLDLDEDLEPGAALEPGPSTRSSTRLSSGVSARWTGTRPVHLRPSSLLLAFVGGTFGTAARAGVSLAVPASGHVPYATAAVNVVGAFLLGLLVGWLSRGPDHGRRRTLRLLLGTGFLGGFTTYSALATDGVLLVAEGLPGAAVGYGLGTVVVGGLAAWAGIATSAPRSGARPRPAGAARGVGQGV